MAIASVCTQITRKSNALVAKGLNPFSSLLGVNIVCKMDEQCLNAETSAASNEQLCIEKEPARPKRVVTLTAKALVEKA